MDEELPDDPEDALELLKVPGCEMLTAGTESRLGGESLFLRAIVGGVLRKAQSWKSLGTFAGSFSTILRMSSGLRDSPMRCLISSGKSSNSSE